MRLERGIVLRAIDKLKPKPGREEARFHIAVAENDANCLSTCQLSDPDQSQLTKERVDIIDSLDKFLVERFQQTLEDPVLDATVVFAHSRWPLDKQEVKKYGVEQVKVLYKNYGNFFTEEETVEGVDTVLEQFDLMKEFITTSPGLMSLSFHALWARMLTQFTDEYPLVLRLVVITLLIPVDTSECERVFSLMNDIKTNVRSSMGQQNLTNLMLWHAHAVKPVADKSGKGIEYKHISCQEVPVMAILKEFREMASKTFGRRPHRPQPVPSYDYEKHRMSKGGSSSADAQRN